jgi:predicted choloylglycine hydrolase
MSQEYNLVNGDFQHLVLDGTAYEVGKAQGKILKRNKEVRARIEKSLSTFLVQSGFLSSTEPYLKSIGFSDFRELQAFFEEHCPGLNDEMQGFADGLGVKLTEILSYSASYTVPKNCSQVAVLSSVTNDKHVYVGRSYEWTYTEEDLRLCTTRIEGKAKHIGFSTFLFGRADGMNEHGVSATFTGGGIFGVPCKHKGFQSHLVIRSILDNCKSVNDAIKFVQKIPVSGFFSLMIADRSSNVALVEFADGVRDMRRIDNNSEDGCLISTNHYTLPATLKSNELNCGIIGQSKKRYTLLALALKNSAQTINKERLHTVLSRKFPEGICDHYYSEGFGTVWSIIFDLTSAQAEICFGAPTHNRWRLFSLNQLASVKQYPAIFPDARGKWPY